MFRIILSSLIFLLLVGCAKKELLLPVISADGQSEIQNHSSIWIFFKTSGTDTVAVLNKNNKLLNTNWIYNIDRRLKMKHIIPHLEALQENRNKPSVHKKGGMENFFSYADSESERVSLVSFSQIDFVKHPESISKLRFISVDKENEPADSICTVHLKIQGEFFEINEKKISFPQVKLLKQELGNCKDNEEVHVRLAFDKNLLYQNYLTAKSHLSNAQIMMTEREDVYSLK